MTEPTADDVSVLKGISGFPVAVARLSASDFSKPIKVGNSVTFGLDRAKAVASLRALADAFERGDELYLQKVEVTTNAAIDDFTFTTLSIEYAAKVGAEPIKEP